MSTQWLVEVGLQTGTVLKDHHSSRTCPGMTKSSDERSYKRASPFANTAYFTSWQVYLSREIPYDFQTTLHLKVYFQEIQSQTLIHWTKPKPASKRAEAVNIIAANLYGCRTEERKAENWVKVGLSYKCWIIKTYQQNLEESLMFHELWLFSC